MKVLTTNITTELLKSSSLAIEANVQRKQ